MKNSVHKRGLVVKFTPYIALTVLTASKVFLIIIVFKSIFRDVKRAFKTSLAHKLDRLGVSNDGGPQHG